MLQCIQVKHMGIRKPQSCKICIKVTSAAVSHFVCLASTQAYIICQHCHCVCESQYSTCAYLNHVHLLHMWQVWGREFSILVPIIIKKLAKIFGSKSPYIMSSLIAVSWLTWTHRCYNIILWTAQCRNYRSPLMASFTCTIRPCTYIIHNAEGEILAMSKNEWFPSYH